MKRCKTIILSAVLKVEGFHCKTLFGPGPIGPGKISMRLSGNKRICLALPLHIFVFHQRKWIDLHFVSPLLQVPALKHKDPPALLEINHCLHKKQHTNHPKWKCGNSCINLFILKWARMKKYRYIWIYKSIRAGMMHQPKVHFDLGTHFPTFLAAYLCLQHIHTDERFLHNLRRGSTPGCWPLSPHSTAGPDPWSAQLYSPFAHLHFRSSLCIPLTSLSFQTLRWTGPAETAATIGHLWRWRFYPCPSMHQGKNTADTSLNPWKGIGSGGITATAPPLFLSTLTDFEGCHKRVALLDAATETRKSKPGPVTWFWAWGGKQLLLKLQPEFLSTKYLLCCSDDYTLRKASLLL